ncbi:S-methyl-5-thioribose-1-phosphate isomerase [Candidatus Protofrankia californiensis]|uniref:S-methyl-5-thioribose-1-phosphate isomerase n=1 Tax=Candidatus Protofrankia californiensis TaxID=1839754 RepID=UPI0010418E69|nr:S-methyl-5-thioribose-1-phosphate isomerase [Candidatus Protofrankia californiensis]
MTPVGRPVSWTGNGIRLLDQTALPGRVVHVDVTDVDALVGAVRRLVIRGAPALGATGAFGVALAAAQADRENWDAATLAQAIGRIRDARPTALALALGVDAAHQRLVHGIPAVLAYACDLLEQDERANRAIGVHGADWLLRNTPFTTSTTSTARRTTLDTAGGSSDTSDGTGRRPLRILTHCNTGALATAGWGTALGIVRELYARGELEIVYVDETRPLLQGSRLTAWELDVENIPHLVQVDAAAAGTIVRGLVDAAVVGADRIAANGDVANKVGTLGVALACAYARIPFVVAASASTVDPATASGDMIPIELRDGEEVLSHAGSRVAPPRSRAHNPAFDVTPASLVDALVTEHGIVEVARGQRPEPLTPPPAGTNPRTGGASRTGSDPLAGSGPLTGGGDPPIRPAAGS